MADAVTPDAAAAEAPDETQAEAAPKTRSRLRLSTRTRFGVAYLVLAALVGAAVGFFVVFLGDSTTSGPVWSAFRPTDHGDAAAVEIARHVSREYRLETGDQIVGVIAGAPVYQNTPISTIAVSTGFPDEQTSDIKVYRANHSMLYILCGFGKNCSIPTGTPTTERALLLRREGLELALYTFKYVNGVDSVFAFIPPPPGQQPKTALFFRKSDLGAELGMPLRRTLSPRDQLIPGGLTSRTQQVVHGLTGNRLYSYGFRTLPDGTAAIVLSPLTA